VQAKGCVLTRAYPVATAGTPSSQNFDPATSTFNYSYTTDPQASNPDTEIALPAPRYRAGYSVSFSAGADAVQVASPPSANPLVVENRRGKATTAVTLTVTATDPNLCSLNAGQAVPAGTAPATNQLPPTLPARTLPLFLLFLPVLAILLLPLIRAAAQLRRT
jgi:hypothetical protein